MERLLPRHMQIIYEINHRVLEGQGNRSDSGKRAPDLERREREREKESCDYRCVLFFCFFSFPASAPSISAKLSIIEESFPKLVRMANLSIMGCHSVNGVAKIHSRIVKETIFPEFHALYPGKFNNKTNGITPRWGEGEALELYMVWCSLCHRQPFVLPRDETQILASPRESILGQDDLRLPRLDKARELDRMYCWLICRICICSHVLF